MDVALAHSHEWLKDYFYSPPWDSTPGLIEWYGPAPRLSTEDGSTSYADIVDAPGVVGYPSVTIAPTSAIRDYLKARIQIRMIGADAPRLFSVEVGFEDDPIGWDTIGLTGDVFTVGTGDWETHEVTFALDPASLAELRDVHGPAGMVTASVFPAESPPVRFQVSLIQILTMGEDARPLRWRQRNDGLGGGAPVAARGVRTQQGSIRHRGIL